MQATPTLSSVRMVFCPLDATNHADAGIDRFERAAKSAERKIGSSALGWARSDPKSSLTPARLAVGWPQSRAHPEHLFPSSVAALIV